VDVTRTSFYLFYFSGNTPGEAGSPKTSDNRERLLFAGAEHLFRSDAVIVAQSINQLEIELCAVVYCSVFFVC